MDNGLAWIVETKFHLPVLRRDTIRRPRLLLALDEVLATCKLTMIAAPAGYGKTTLVAGALHDLPGTSLWLALDAEDNDPARFLLALIHTFRRLHPGCGALAHALLASLANPGAEMRRVIGVLINEILEALSAPCVLVLDDLHVIDEPAVYAGLEYLLERMPPLLHLAVTTRSDPPLALSRLRAQRQLAEFRLEDLCFTSGETAALLNEQLRLNLGGADLDLLQRTTSGWAAGLSLVASSLSRRGGRAEQGRLLDSLAHAGRFIFDFMVEEVLDREEAAIRAFLLETSILIDLTPESCAAVTGRADAGQLLEAIYQRNLFVVAADAAERILRYHPLFAEVLQAQLAREMPGRSAELHRRAAAAEPLAERAIGHYLAAQEWDLAARAIEQIGDRLVRQGLLDLVHGWVAALPPAVSAARPLLQYLLGMCALRQGRTAEAGRCLEAALAGFSAVDDRAGRGATQAELAAWTFIQGDFERSAALVEQALVDPQAPAIEVQLLLGQSRLAFLSRNWPQVLASFDQAMALCEQQRDGAVFALLANYTNLLMIAGLSGGLERLERLVRWAEGAPEVMVGPAQVAIDAQRVAINLWRGDLGRSIEAGERALALSRRLGGSAPHLDLLLPTMLAIVYLASGNSAAADSYFEQLLRQLGQGVIAGPLAAGALYTLGRARWQQGRIAEAQQIYAQLCALNPAHVPAVILLGMILRGLLASAAGALGEAEQALRQATQLEQTLGGPTQVFGSARLALAQFYQRCGRRREALEELAPVLESCAQEQRLGLVLREGPPIIPLLGLAVRHGTHGPFAAELLRRLGVAGELQPLHNPETGETLSAREVEVLRLLAAGASNKEIAAALIISQPTVKSHLLHIFQKLNVRTRTQAAARARQLLPL
jgi:LuxR family maltose regulon positive regulatory protein